ncbi:MAG: hypothetical protein WBC14_04190 [Propionicimonas sp.]|jgi:hypothetical protein
MPLPFTRPHLEADVGRSLAAFLGSRPRILAWSRTTTGYLVGLSDRFAHQVDGAWAQTPWHQIQRGHWDEKTSSLTWTDADGRDCQASLSHPGRFPELFTERVTASVLFQRRVDLGRGRYLIVALRRELGGSSTQTHWTVVPGGGADLQEPGARAAADQALAATRAEYDIA